MPYQDLCYDDSFWVAIGGGSNSRLNLYGYDELADFKADLTELQKLVEAGLRLIETTQTRDATRV